MIGPFKPSSTFLCSVFRNCGMSFNLLARASASSLSLSNSSIVGRNKTPVYVPNIGGKGGSPKVTGARTKDDMLLNYYLNRKNDSSHNPGVFCVYNAIESTMPQKILDANANKMVFLEATKSALVKGWQILPMQLPPLQPLPPLPSRSPATPKTIIDPHTNIRPLIPVSFPLTERRPEIRATNRVKRQRWRHVRKKHRKQRLREMRHIIMKQQNEREMAAETKFRKEMSVALKKALEFDAEKYVRETIARAKWVPTADNTESLRKGVAWSEFMTVEQLFGVPEGDYIDKKAGLAGDEDWQKILELREKYEKEYRRKK